MVDKKFDRKTRGVSVCRLETLKVVESKVESGMTKTKAIKETSEETEIPAKTLKKWYYPPKSTRTPKNNPKSEVTSKRPSKTKRLETIIKELEKTIDAQRNEIQNLNVENGELKEKLKPKVFLLDWKEKAQKKQEYIDELEKLMKQKDKKIERLEKVIDKQINKELKEDMDKPLSPVEILYKKAIKYLKVIQKGDLPKGFKEEDRIHNIDDLSSIIEEIESEEMKKVSKRDDDFVKDIAHDWNIN